MWNFRAIVNIFYIFINKLTILYDTLERSGATTIWLRSVVAASSAIFSLTPTSTTPLPPPSPTGTMSARRSRAASTQMQLCVLPPRFLRLGTLRLPGKQRSMDPGCGAYGGRARTPRLCGMGLRGGGRLQHLRRRGCAQDKH
jgi:hypothetical protein